MTKLTDLLQQALDRRQGKNRLPESHDNTVAKPVKAKSVLGSKPVKRASGRGR